MRRTNKKGFTIVELVIVIAVVAILAAVLIPTFASLVKKANVSKDTQLIKNLNTALASDTNPHNNMTDALNAAAEFGYDVAKINASATGNEILWDSVNDVFCYYDADAAKIKYISTVDTTAVEDYQYWQITDEVPATQTYSIYYTGTTPFGGTLSVGFDAGTTTGHTLTYKNTVKRTVVIRTTGGSLTIDAPNDTVHHYGEAETVTITAIASASYHAYGKIGYIEVQNGRVVVEPSAEVFAVYSQSGNAIIDNNSGILHKAGGASGVTNSGNVTLETITALETMKTEAKNNFNAEVKVNEQYFATIQDALGNLDEKFGQGYLASGKAVIVLQRDVVAMGIVVENQANITIDFNGYTYNITTGVGSEGTPTNGLQLLEGSTVVLKNGTLTASANSRVVTLIQNYTNLTVENMVIDASNLSSSNTIALALNQGKVEVSNSRIIAPSVSGAIAFEVCAWGQYQGANVIVKNDSVIDGNAQVKVYGGKNAPQKGTDALALCFESCTLNGKWTEVTDATATANVVNKVTRKQGLNIAAPTGYKWGDVENGYQTLVKE